MSDLFPVITCEHWLAFFKRHSLVKNDLKLEIHRRFPPPKTQQQQPNFNPFPDGKHLKKSNGG